MLKNESNNNLKVLNAKMIVKTNSAKLMTTKAYAKYILGASVKLFKALKLTVMRMGVAIHKKTKAARRIKPLLNVL